jgi:hypothetical protein
MSFMTYKIGTGIDVGKLTDLITKTINPPTWQRLGGDGFVGSYQIGNPPVLQFLLVWQSDDVQSQILAALGSSSLNILV